MTGRMGPDGRRAPRTLLLLVRHAQTALTGRRLPGRAPGVHLSPAGRRQAAALARRLARLPRVAAVYASPLERARETAVPIARALGLEVRVDAGLQELDVGRWTGAAVRTLRQLPEWQSVQQAPARFAFPEGESFADMQARVTGALDRLIGRHPGRTVVAVSHADPIKAAVAHALGMPLDLFQRLVVSPASVTALAYGPDGPAVLALNVPGAGVGPLVRP